jgi:hypothetical protein
MPCGIEHRSVLAAYVRGPADWLGITPAFPELNRLNQLVQERRHQSGDDARLPVLADDETFLAWYQIHRAIWGLEATIDMAEEVQEWSSRIDRMKQIYCGV